MQVSWAFIFPKYSHYEDQSHLSGVTGRGVKVCGQAPQDVQDATRAAIEKKLKTVAGSSNGVMAEQGDALSLEELADWIANFPSGETELQES